MCWLATAKAAAPRRARTLLNLHQRTVWSAEVTMGGELMYRHRHIALFGLAMLVLDVPPSVATDISDARDPLAPWRTQLASKIGSTR
jgi:hypothetical protein